MGSFTYVEMKCRLEEDQVRDPLDPSLSLKHLSEVSPEILYQCYLESFQKGDAQFFQYQDQTERRRYFQEELGFREALENPASIALFLEEVLVGYSLVMSYLEKNYHISCMCLIPEYQGRGWGAQMLTTIKAIALENGMETLTLGTEPGMKAYQLYRKAGFEITAEHNVGN